MVTTECKINVRVLGLLRPPDEKETVKISNKDCDLESVKFFTNQGVYVLPLQPLIDSLEKMKQR